MAQPTIQDDEDKPLDPAVEKVRKKLVRFIAINIGLLLVALMAVVLAIVYKARTSSPRTVVAGEIASPEGMIEADIVLPAGARLLSQSLSGNRILLDAELSDGSRALFLYDVAERRMIGRFSITPQ
jgi:hypothetical protein